MRRAERRVKIPRLRQMARKFTDAKVLRRFDPSGKRSTVRSVAFAHRKTPRRSLRSNTIEILSCIRRRSGHRVFCFFFPPPSNFNRLFWTQFLFFWPNYILIILFFVVLPKIFLFLILSIRPQNIFHPHCRSLFRFNVM